MTKIMEKENYYGHRKRLLWINDRIKKGTWLDIGCGTGSMLTIPLIQLGKDVYGLDNAQISINAAQKIAQSYGIDPERFICEDVKSIGMKYDGVIVSEVLEHIEDAELSGFIDNICNCLKKDGRLIVTVPNGKGTYEKAQKHKDIWLKICKMFVKVLGNVLHLLGVKKHNNKKHEEQNEEHMTLSDSKHVQFFSKDDIVKIFESRGFELIDFNGSCMFSGICINALLPPIEFVTNLNNKLGDIFPLLASGYYFLFRKK